ncbi:hypothetical protein [Streptomyces sp. NPDC054952]
MQIQVSTATAYARWYKRPYVPPADIERDWQQLRAITRQLLERQPARTARHTRAAAVARAREAETAPLPEQTLLALWHNACLAAVIGDLQ